MTTWKTVKLSELGTIVGGATPATSHDEYYNGDIPWLTPKDLAGYVGRYISRGERNISRAGLESCSAKMLPKNSILFSSRAPIGYIAIAQNDLCTNQGFKSIVPNDKVNHLFLYYLLKYNKEKIESLGSGTTFKEVSAATMREVEVYIPDDVHTQEAIGSILDTIDSIIENNYLINSNLEKQASIFIDEYYLKSRGFQRLSSIMDFCNGFAFQSSTYLPKGKYKIITIKNVLDGSINSQGTSYIDEFPAKMNKRCILQLGDVLLSLTGNVGRVGIVCEENLLLNQRVAKFMPKHPCQLPFLYFLFRHQTMKTRLQSIAKGTAQINLSPIETLRLTIPYEREKIIFLSKKLLFIYKIIIYNTQINHSLITARNILLPKLMSGEIDVSKLENLSSRK